MSDFKRICAMLAVRNCYESGVSVSEIATQAGKSVSTIKRWLRITGVMKP